MSFSGDLKNNRDMTEIDLETRLAENIKCLRKKKKLTQFELAEKSDVSEMTIKKIETGKQWPSGKTLAQIASALEVDIYNLFLPVPSSFDLNEKIKKSVRDALRRSYRIFVAEETESVTKDF